jgi:hypothetical protein
VEKNKEASYMSRSSRTPVAEETFSITGGGSDTEFYFYYEYIHDRFPFIEVKDSSGNPITSPTVQKERLSWDRCKITFDTAPANDHTVTVQGQAPKFVAVLVSGDTENTNIELKALNEDGLELGFLTGYGTDGYYDGAMHPNGQQFLFISDRDIATRDIYVVDLEFGKVTGTPTRLTTETGGTLRHLNISPDGKKLAWATTEGLGNESIKIADYDTDAKSVSNISFLKNTSSWDTLSKNCFNPESTKVVFTTNKKVRTINTDGTGESADFANSPPEAIFPAWGPDNKEFVCSGTGDSGTDRDIIRINADGSGSPVDLTQDITSTYDYPIWLPDATTIIFATESPQELQRINRDGTGNSVIKDTTHGSNRQPSYGRILI